jgi:thiol-disulfide isomerase/thioredoxin
MLLPILLIATLAACPGRPEAAGEVEAPFRALTFDAALTAAAKEKKFVMIDFFTTWCAPCKKLDQVTWRDAGVKAFLDERTVPLKIDAEQEVELARRFRLPGYPTIVFVRPDGSEAGRLVGYRDPLGFLRSAGAFFVAPKGIEQAKLMLVGHENDPLLHEQLAVACQEAGELEAALRELLWCFDQGATANPAYAPRRASALVQKLAELGAAYLPARAALLERRTALATGLVARTTRVGEATVVARIDAALEQSDKSLELYDELDGHGDTLADARMTLARELLEVFRGARRYAEILRNEKDPVSAVRDDLASARRESLALAAQAGAEPTDPTALRTKVQALWEPVERLASTYHEAALGTGRLDEAQAIAAAFLADEVKVERIAALVDGALHAEAPEAARRLVATWEAKLPEAERAKLRAVAAHIPE